MDTPTLPSDPLAGLSAAELVKRTLDDARQLARAELELAKQDLRAELKSAIRGVAELAGAFACATLVIACLVISIVLTTGGAKLALGFAVMFAVAGALLGAFGFKALPKKLLEPTRRRITNDVDRLKEHIA